MTHDCHDCGKNFYTFYSLRQHKTQAENLRKTVAHVVTLYFLEINDGDKNLQDEIQTCKHFLVDSEIEKPRLKKFSYAIETVSTKMWEELDHVSNTWKWAAKVNQAFGFFSKNVEGGRSGRFYVLEINTLQDRSELVHLLLYSKTYLWVARKFSYPSHC